MSIQDVRAEAMDPVEFARLVKGTPIDELRQVLRGERRGEILDHLIGGMPSAFRPEAAGRTRAVVHWRIGDRPDGGVDTYEMIIADGTCTLSPSADRQPQLTLNLAAADFVHLVTGNAHAVMLVMRGRLKTRGDLGLTARFPNFFAAPRP
ncbi:SCP2 sterol-binding domain-containing protein [Micromonospora radicis]|uniref:Acyl-CoA synthase n=1 Tax=Micromonospora radicis TaxID=1894971 RepID=A0A418MYI7_9ACTN|nr:SCP2 sterol-binding domain-containing protein [Micromonospora radicis]RIV40272.1 acyl-CoA synthase [Micromonospora radicis]